MPQRYISLNHLCLASTRSWTSLKVVGDGSFGTVWLCDWHGTLPPNTPLSPMQCGAGARAEWSGKRLVAVKRMKKKWEGGWNECRRLKELESLRAIPSHPNIIPLYDSFLLPDSKELYFVFESMEGNLYQLIKSRKGRPLAGGLVYSIYSQVVNGLHHIHASGYFHRDMKPENLLVTTTGLTDYPSTSPIAPPGAPAEKDVVVIIKLADFGLARETRSRPPYTEYVSTRWYRAPEVLLRSREYSNPVDMWALGTILAELINLKPLFPGAGEIDQVARICETLGDPNHNYGVDERGRLIGGGLWMKGVQMAKQVGFKFPEILPKHFRSFFDPSIPPSLIDCIEDLLRYDPEARLTSQQCLSHPYLTEASHRTQALHPPLHITTTPTPNRTQRTPVYSDSLPCIPPRAVPPSHSQSPAHLRPAFNAVAGHVDPSAPQRLPEAPSHRVPFYPSSGHHSQLYGSPQVHLIASEFGQPREYDLPADDLASYGHRTPPSPSSLNSFPVIGGHAGRMQTRSPDTWGMDLEISPAPESRDATFSGSHDSPMEVPQSPIVHSLPPDDDPVASQDYSLGLMDEVTTPISSHNKLGKLGSLGFGKKHSKWALPLFGHGGDKHQANPLPPVDELNVSSSRSTPSLKRTQTSSTADSRSLPEVSPTGPVIQSAASAVDAKKLKKEQERQARDAEKARRAQAEKMQRDQARAVMQKRNQMIKQNTEGSEIDWQSTHSSMLAAKVRSRITVKGKQRADPSLPPALESEEDHEDWLSHRSKARRRDLDDDHSMSSSEVHSISRMSMISFASGDSDPGPARTFRQRPAHSAYNLPRATSISSLRTSSGRGFSPSARSSNSFDRQFVREFHERATFEPAMSDTGSPPPIHDLSISPTQSHAHWSPNSPDQVYHQQTGGQPNATGSLAARRLHDSRLMSLPPITSLQPHSSQPSPYEPGSTSHPSSPYPVPHSAVNPMFQVPPFPSPPILPTHHPSSQQGALPPFSHLLSVADQQRPPSSLEQRETQ
ncbi:kinase-like domain-containing protein [Gautieria morchelliformis]|nr:kinase-like domain-containing protein [Gautieria morchelliformis]